MPRLYRGDMDKLIQLQDDLNLPKNLYVAYRVEANDGCNHMLLFIIQVVACNSETAKELVTRQAIEMFNIHYDNKSPIKVTIDKLVDSHQEWGNP